MKLGIYRGAFDYSSLCGKNKGLATFRQCSIRRIFPILRQCKATRLDREIFFRTVWALRIEAFADYRRSSARVRGGWRNSSQAQKRLKP